MTFRALCACLALLCLPALVHAQTFPKLTGQVVDGAGLLAPAQEQALTQKLAALEQDSGRQLVVVTLPDLQGYEIADYGYRLGRAWGIGTKDRNDGALLIVAPKERKVRIEVGYGLEGILTDAMSALIINNAIVPRFKAGDFPGGIASGVDEISTLLKLPPDEARARAAAVTAKAKHDQQDDGVGSAIFVLFFIGFFVVLPMIRRARGGRRYGGSAWPIMLFGPAIGSNSGWGRGNDNDWGGGGGGGFSGGGGSFGGGGASGSW